MKKTIIIVILFLLTNTLFATRTKVDKAKEAQAKAWVKNQQLEFIENKGQFTNTEGKPADNVLFKASYGNCDIYITNKGLSYVFVKFEERQKEESEESETKRSQAVTERSRGGIGRNEFEKDEDENKIPLYYRLDMDLVGATIDKANIIKEEESKQGHYNYFYPHCPEGIYDVKGYGKITIKNIYKGIDWVIYTNPDNKKHPLKYDFVVNTNADYKDIKIKYLNAQSISLLDNDTKLNIQTIAGNIEEGNIYSYQKDTKEIRSNYIINKDSTIAFEVSNYDKTQTLIIDPLVWATYYGGNNYDAFISICVDSKDNVYITGYACSTDFPIQQMTGAYWQANNIGAINSEDVIILKFNCRGVRLWATYYGGNEQDDGSAISIDSQDNIYIVGSTASSNLPTQQLAGAYWQNTNEAPVNSFNAFILKFNDQGIRQWATYYGGNNWDDAYSICIDSKDNVYITGLVSSSNFPTQQLTGAYWQSSILGNENVFILKFNNQGVRLWATYYGGESEDAAESICVDSHDNIYLTGITYSASFPIQQKTGAYLQSTYASSSSSNIAFILEFDKNGVRQWATYYGGSNEDDAFSICTDSKDNVYVTGTTCSQDFPVFQQSGAYWQPNIAGPDGNVYILKFDSNGVRKWATYYGGNILDIGYFIKTDNQDNLYITGETTSSNFPTQQLNGEYWQQSLSGGADAFILEFNDKGVRQWSTYYGSSYGATGASISFNSNKDLFLIGIIQDSNAYTIDPGNGAYYQNICNAYRDGFILKFENNSNIPTTLQTSRNIICENDNGTITLTATGNFGDILKWYSGNCGQNFIGQKTPLTISSPIITTTYYASIESACYSYCDSITITVIDCDTVQNIIPDIYIPNSFTPNGDGLNDVFNIKTTYEFSDYKLVIYDRWGEMIFESDDKNKGWDGTYKGKAVPLDVYIYQLTATIKDTGEQKKITGRVTVVR